MIELLAANYPMLLLPRYRLLQSCLALSELASFYLSAWAGMIGTTLVTDSSNLEYPT
ncbi:MAG: hypothetical protein JXA58_07710 [Dehalococcoidia bacterium]|nr:hypothetical protein [Dehalococcoidia bacterium]